MASTSNLSSHPVSFPLKTSLLRSPVKGTNLRCQPITGSDLAGVWKEINGSRNWDGLLHPLNPILKREIIRYGELANVCYRAFDQNPDSKRYLGCRHVKRTLFAGMNSGYNVTKFLYATAGVDVDFPGQTQNSSRSRWIGYVAVASDDEVVRRLGRRDIVVAFRGTVTAAEWIANFMSSLTPAMLDPYQKRPDLKVETGFLRLYTSADKTCRFDNLSCRDQALHELLRLIGKHKDEELSITLTGHSMGSSLAILFGYDIVELGLNQSNRRPIPTTVYSFAGPRVGNVVFKERCEELGLKVLRVVNVNDPVTKVPGMFFNEKLGVIGWSSSSSCYSHLGVELALEFSGINDPVCAHDLEKYIEFLRLGELVVGSDERKEEKEEEEEDDILKKLMKLWSWQDGSGDLSCKIRFGKPTLQNLFGGFGPFGSVNLG